MDNTLEELLRVLHSDEDRLAFLKSVYVPGNTEVVDRVLSIETDGNILRTELEYAREHGPEDRFVALARRYIDYYVENDLDILLRNEVIEWNNPILAEYAIASLSSTPAEGIRLENRLSYASEIANAFGKDDEARKLLERVLNIQLRDKSRDKEYAFVPAKTLAKLGQYDEAIDYYLKTDRYHWIDNALIVAREHSPQRVRELAQKGFDSFNTGEILFADLYVECAEILGRTEEARRTLLKHAGEVKIDSPPRFYKSLVEGLIKLGHEKEARRIVSKVAKISRAYEVDELEELAQLYWAIGEPEEFKRIYADIIDTRIRERHHPSSGLKAIENVIELTGDHTFLKRAFALYEQGQEYDKAAQLATQLGEHGLAAAYSWMGQMIAEVKSIRVAHDEASI